MTEEEFSELAAGYALHALSPADLAAFERALVAHPEWQAIVDADAAAAAALADGVADVPPPLTMRSTLLSAIAVTPQHTSDASAGASGGLTVAGAGSAGGVGDADAPGHAEHSEEAGASERSASAPPYVEPAPTTTTIQAVERRNWTRGLLALAASVVFLVVLGFGAATINEQVNRTPAQIALAEIEDAPDAQSSSASLSDGGTATVYWSESLGEVVVTATSLPDISDEEDFQLWFVRGEAPVSAGTFDAAGSGITQALLDGSLEPGDAVAITVEPAGGSPTGAPTTEPIVIIPTA